MQKTIQTIKKSNEKITPETEHYWCVDTRIAMHNERSL